MTRKESLKPLTLPWKKVKKNKWRYQDKQFRITVKYNQLEAWPWYACISVKLKIGIWFALRENSKSTKTELQDWIAAKIDPEYENSLHMRDETFP